MSHTKTDPQVRTLSSSEIDTVAGGGMLSGALSEAIKNIGSAMSTMARKG